MPSGYGPYQMTVWDPAGTVILSSEGSAAKLRASLNRDLSWRPAGVYLIQLRAEQQRYQAQLVKQ